MSLPKPYYEREGQVVYHADCLELLPLMEAGSVDAVITDPPYFRVKQDAWDRQWENDEAFAMWIGSLCEYWRRLLRPNGSLYVFASPERAWIVEGEIRMRFRFLNSIRWIKVAGWHQKSAKTTLRSFLSPWECLLFAEQHGQVYEDAAQSLHKNIYAPIGHRIGELRNASGLKRAEVDTTCAPSRKPTGLCYRWESGDCLPTLVQYIDLLRLCGDRRDYEELRREYEELRREYEELRRPFRLDGESAWSDIWYLPTVDPAPDKHPTEKPIALCERPIRYSTSERAMVLDPFLGSGTTLVACARLGRRGVGIEIEERYAEIAAKRLDKELDQKKLPLEVS